VQSVEDRVGDHCASLVAVVLFEIPYTLQGVAVALGTGTEDTRPQPTNKPRVRGTLENACCERRVFPTFKPHVTVVENAGQCKGSRFGGSTRSVIFALRRIEGSYQNENLPADIVPAFSDFCIEDKVRYFV